MLYFTEIVAQGGFAAAGRSLNMPKSRLSRRFADLEAQLGVRLLQRTTRKLRLTPVGETYLRHCQAMREQAQAAQEAVAHMQTAPQGRVRVACPVTLAQSTVADLLPGFMARYPLVTLELQVSNRVVDLVEEGFDLALRVRSTLEDSATLVVKNFGKACNVLVASPAQLQRQGRPLNVQDLARLDTLDMAARDGKSQWQLLGPGGQVHVHHHLPRVAMDDLATLKHLVVQGIGMCFLPDYLCRAEIAQGQLEEVLPGWAPPPGIVHAVFPSRRGMLPAVRSFLDYLGEHFAQEGVDPISGPEPVTR
jgi:DNA-binding transcriptional LysR family regulator